MRLSVVLIAAAIACAMPATAQEKKLVTVAPALAGSEAVSPHMLALSRRYIELMQADQMTAMLRQMVSAQLQADDSLRGVSQEDRDFITQLTTDMVDEMVVGMLDELAPLYARTFTEAELRALIDFYGSEQGRAILTKTYAAGAEAQTAMMSVLPPILEKMGARICERYGCDAEEREALLDEMEGAMGGHTAAAPRRK
jgi:hypothetical protein